MVVPDCWRTPLSVQPEQQAPSFDVPQVTPEQPRLISVPAGELVPAHLIPETPPGVLFGGPEGELVPADLIPAAPRMLSLREVVAGADEGPDGVVVEPRGLVASLQRITAATVAISIVLAVLVGVGFGVYFLLESLNQVGGGTESQDLFAVGVWGVLMLLVGRPRLGKPGKRSKKKNGLALSGFVVLYPVLAAVLTASGLLLAGDPAAVPTLAAAGVSFGVCGWRLVQAASALKKRDAHFARTAVPATAA